MSKFNFDMWKDKKVCMHCKTEEEAKDFCRVMHEAGLRWCDGKTYIYSTKFKRYGCVNGEPILYF